MPFVGSPPNAHRVDDSSRNIYAVCTRLRSAVYMQSLLTFPSITRLQVYDWLLTLDEEVFLIWPSRFGVPKFLFFCNRYFPFIDLVFLTYGERVVLVLSSRTADHVLLVLMAGSDPSVSFTHHCRVFRQTLFPYNRDVVVQLCVRLFQSLGG